MDLSGLGKLLLGLGGLLLLIGALLVLGGRLHQARQFFILLAADDESPDQHHP